MMGKNKSTMMRTTAMAVAGALATPLLPMYETAFAQMNPPLERGDLADFRQALRNAPALILDGHTLNLPEGDNGGAPFQIFTSELRMLNGSQIVTGGADLEIYALSLTVIDSGDADGVVPGGTILAFPSAETAPETAGEGAQGTHGRDAGTVSIYVAEQVTGDRLRVRLHGQAGGAGGPGATGTPGGRGDPGRDGVRMGTGCTTGGDGERGEKGQAGLAGGNGGQGGDGGILRLGGVLTVGTNFVVASLNPGAGGAGGAGGEGGAGGPGGRGGGHVAPRLFHPVSCPGGNAGSQGQQGDAGPVGVPGDDGSPGWREEFQITHR